MCVCVCVRDIERESERERERGLYKENRKKNSYECLRIDLLISSTNAFRQDCLKHEITKISGKKFFCHHQGGNSEFKIAV